MAGAFALLLTLAAGSTWAQASSPVVAIAAELIQDDRSATLTLTLSKPVEATASPMERPDRIVIDLPEINFQLKPEVETRRGGLISNFRYGLFAPGKSRIVIDLRQPSTVARIESAMRPLGEAATLTIELTRADRDAFRAAAREARGPVDAQASAPQQPGPADRRHTIVIDPGHGGVDPGAIGAGGIMEKDIVFSFAQRLKARLEASGRYRVLLTRESDVFITLGDRVRFSRGAQADLFVSIHADSLSTSPTVRGATVYTRSDRATDAESQTLADKENLADATAGAETVETPEEISGILADLTRRETRLFSQQVAKHMVSDMRGSMRLNKNPHRSAGFRVLTAPDVPSILIELGYLSSAEDIALLMSENWQEKSTGAIASAIERYFAERTPIAGRAAIAP